MVESVTDFKFLAMLLMPNVKISFQKMFVFLTLLLSLEALWDIHLPKSHNPSDSYKQGFPKGISKIFYAYDLDLQYNFYVFLPYSILHQKACSSMS